MSTRPRDCYTSDPEFASAVKQLNALCDASRPFQSTQANKDHRDAFGDTIERGESYFKREFGGGFGNDVKLSAASMERLCSALFFGNQQLVAIAEKLAERRAKEAMDLQASVARLVSED